MTGEELSHPRGRLLQDEELATALGVPLKVARAFVQHQRIDGTLTEDGHVSAYAAEVVAWRAANAEAER